MYQNPYEPPQDMGRPREAKRALLLAAVGAFLASGYWAVVALLLRAAATTHGSSGPRLIVPIVLIAIYAVRGYQMLTGDVGAARRIVWVHGVGGAFAILQMAGGVPFVVVLNGVKVLIHIFGGVMAWRAVRES